MTLRKITVDDGVKYTHKVNKLNLFQEEELVHQTQRRKFRFLLNKTKNFHRITKKHLKTLTGQGFREFRRKTKCYFFKKNIQTC